jgi:glucose/arabinose dehydrogenase
MPYLVDAKNDTAGYRLTSERGTIQRVSADFKKRETVCTGIRYPVGAAFNPHRRFVRHRTGRRDVAAEWQSTR